MKSQHQMNEIEQNAFEMHCRNNIFFFCPLCDMFHEKIKDRETGELRGHSLCQMPNVDESDYVDKDEWRY